MKKPGVRHYRNGPGIDVCLCGARGGALVWSMTLGGVTCAVATRKLREKRRPKAAAAWAARMRKVTVGKLRSAGWL